MSAELRRTGWAALGILLVGCTAVVESGPEGIRVDTGQFGEFVPRTRGWLGWFKANEHCAAYGRRPQLADVSGSIAGYRCVKED
jgi:hypothetical protein